MKPVPIAQYLNPAQSTRAADPDRSAMSPFRIKAVQDTRSKPAPQRQPSVSPFRPAFLPADKQKRPPMQSAALAATRGPPTSSSQGDAETTSDRRSVERYYQGVADGQEAARQKTEAEFQDKLAQEREAARVARARLIEKEIEAIRQGFNAGLDRIQSDMAQVAARILQNFMHEQKTKEIAAAIQQAIATLRSSGDCIVVRGPENLLALLRGHVPPFDNLQFENVESEEVTISADNCLIESQFRAWAALLGQPQVDLPNV